MAWRSHPLPADVGGPREATASSEQRQCRVDLWPPCPRAFISQLVSFCHRSWLEVPRADSLWSWAFCCHRPAPNAQGAVSAASSRTTPGHERRREGPRLTLWAPRGLILSLSPRWQRPAPCPSNSTGNLHPGQGRASLRLNLATVRGHNPGVCRAGQAGGQPRPGAQGAASTPCRATGPARPETRLSGEKLGIKVLRSA